ncbi:AMP-binding protein [Halalkalibacter krulwichiae]|uniref:Long-chain-fatty-acid--CoA ligase n=2 Tax=Halalkalibacter krulwichiae TaxID=199441 RepID=A0A1X9M990_9BACI|nr:Long-chain-fatty-acid--CoA ligase [Halalkalibacter krulwichiae]
MYNGIETFGEVVKHRARSHPNKRFIKFENDTLTYDEYHRGGNQAAHMISALGLKKGDTCAVMLPNSSEFLVTWLGLARIGVIEVPINVAYKGDLLTYILNKATCQAIVISSKWVERIKDIADDLTHLSHVIVVGEKVVERHTRFNWYCFNDLLTQAQECDIKVEITPNDPSLILFTSGTTGPSKGVVLSHHANFNLAQTACDLMHYGPDDRLFTVFPLFHVNARYTTVLVALLAGCDVVMHDRFSASKFWDICRKEGITCFNYMGSLLTILMKQPKRANDGDNPVRMVQGAPAPIEIFDEFQSRFNVKITEAYGSTEVGLTMINRAESFRKGSCGKAVNCYEVEIHDEEGRPCPPG